MNLYVGLDVGLNETSVCVIDQDGQSVRETKVATEPEAIRCAIEGFADRLSRVGVEASSLGLWLYRELQPKGFPMIVVEARHMRVSLSTMRNKTDRNDARGIAQMMRLGWYRAVYVKNIDTQRLRTLLANRKLLKRKLVDIENHIRGALRTYGLLVGPTSRSHYEERVKELMEHADYVFVATIETMLEVRRGVLDGFNRLHKILLQVVHHDAVCRRLMTVPGVGPVAALTYKLGVDDPLRFSRSRTVGAHFGLTPRRHQSGTIDHVGRITKQGDISVREARRPGGSAPPAREPGWLRGMNGLFPAWLRAWKRCAPLSARGAAVMTAHPAAAVALAYRAVSIICMTKRYCDLGRRCEVVHTLLVLKPTRKSFWVPLMVPWHLCSVIIYMNNN